MENQLCTVVQWQLTSTVVTLSFSAPCLTSGWLISTVAGREFFCSDWRWLQAAVQSTGLWPDLTPWPTMCSAVSTFLTTKYTCNFAVCFIKPPFLKLLPFVSSAQCTAPTCKCCACNLAVMTSLRFSQQSDQSELLVRKLRSNAVSTQLCTDTKEWTLSLVNLANHGFETPSLLGSLCSCPTWTLKAGEVAIPHATGR